MQHYVQNGDTQDMGTGHALSNFLPLPGGGWLDAYGKKKSPQGTRPISKRLWLWPDTPTQLRMLLDDFRSRLGVRGKLTVRFDDGAQRWQWARLTDVSAPQVSPNRGNWLGVDLTWISASQMWYGIVEGNSWTWGDGSWVWGDATAEMGQNSLVYSLAGTVTPTLTHDGSIDVTNLSMWIKVTATITSFRIDNITNGGYFQWDGTLAAGGRMEINTGGKYVYKIALASSISSFFGATRTGNEVIVATTGSHGLSNGQMAYVEGNTKYDGYWPNVRVITSTTLALPIGGDDTRVGPGTGGNVYAVTDQYSNCTIADLMRWFTLRPGDNALQIQAAPTAGGNTVQLNFYNHFA